MTPDLKTSPEELLKYAMEGDLSDAARSNLHEALAIMQFQLLIQQRRTAKAQMIAAIATVLLFLATIGLVVATA